MTATLKQQQFTATLGAGAVGIPQTPWYSNIDGGGFSLGNVNTISPQVVNASNYIAAPSVYATTSFSAGSQAADFIACNATALLWFSPGAKSRWGLLKSGAESGSDAGSDLYFQRFDDAGNLLGNFLTLVRATGRLGVNLSTPAFAVDVNGDINCSGVYRQSGVPLATLFGAGGAQGVGRIAADGSIIGAPAGWTVAHPATGTYVITHNLGIDPNTYVVLCTPSVNPPAVQAQPSGPPQTSLVIVIGAQTTTDVTIYLVEGSSLNAVDNAFCFGVFKQ